MAFRVPPAAPPPLDYPHDNGSRTAQEGVDTPATSDVWPLATAVIQDVGIVAASVFKGISENKKAVMVERAGRKVAVFVGGLCQSNNGWDDPSGVEGNGAE